MDVTLEMEVQGIQPHRRDQVVIGDNLEGDQHSQAAELLEDQDNLEEYQPCRWEAVEPLAEEYDSEGATALVETDPGYYNTYYTDPAYSQYYHR